METKTKVVTVGGTVAAIAAASLAWQQIGEVFTLRHTHDLVHAAENAAQQIQIIDVQIIQAQMQLDFLLARQQRGQSQPGDDLRIERVNNRITRLEEAREALLRK